MESELNCCCTPLPLRLKVLLLRIDCEFDDYVTQVPAARNESLTMVGTRIRIGDLNAGRV